MHSCLSLFCHYLFLKDDKIFSMLIFFWAGGLSKVIVKAILFYSMIDRLFAFSR